MTVSSTTTSVSYTGDGSTTSFPVTFAFFGTSTDAEIRVIERVIATGVETTLVNGTDYTVSGGSGTTGTVTAASAPAATKRWTVERNTSRTQETDYVENDPFPAESHEQALDRLTMIGQEGYNLATRSFQFATSSTTTASTTVPDPTASAALVWNAGGTALENGPTTSEISSAQTYATNAAASASAASSSASTASTQAGLAATAKTNAETAETNAETAQAAAEAARDLAQGYAADADVAKIEWQGAWQTSTAYALNDAVSNGGSSYICIVAHTSGTFATDLAAAKWELLAQKGTDGSGGTVTSIIAGTGLTGGTITTSGTIAVDIGVTVQGYDATTMKTGAVQTMTKALRGTPVSLTSSSASIATDASAGNFFTHTFTENTTLANPSNLVAGQEGVIVFTQHASSPKTLAYGSYWKFSGGTVPSVTATNSAVDVLVYYVESSARITAKLLTDVK
jgi:hypothetical protein